MSLRLSNFNPVVNVPVSKVKRSWFAKRLFEVLNTHLENNEWLAGDYSIADIANWCWVRTHNWSGVTTDGLINLERWKNQMYDQPGMKKGIKVPVDVENLLKDADKAKEFAKEAEKMVKK